MSTPTVEELLNFVLINGGPRFYENPSPRYVCTCGRWEYAVNGNQPPKFTHSDTCVWLRVESSSEFANREGLIPWE